MHLLLLDFRLMFILIHNNKDHYFTSTNDVLISAAVHQSWICMVHTGIDDRTFYLDIIFKLIDGT